MHAAYDEAKATHRGAVIAIRVSHGETRKLKQRKAEQERERFLDEITGRIYGHMAARKVAIWASSGTLAGRGPPNASSSPGQRDGVETIRSKLCI
jgi:hypothetical protein